MMAVSRYRRRSQTPDVLARSLGFRLLSVRDILRLAVASCSPGGVSQDRFDLGVHRSELVSRPPFVDVEETRVDPQRELFARACQEAVTG